MRTARAVPPPWLCRKTMISRTAFCSAQAAMMRPARIGPMPSTSRRRSGSASMTLPQAIRLRLDDVEHLVAEGAQELLRIDRTNAADHCRGEVLLDALDRPTSSGVST